MCVLLITPGVTPRSEYTGENPKKGWEKDGSFTCFSLFVGLGPHNSFFSPPQFWFFVFGLLTPNFLKNLTNVAWKKEKKVKSAVQRKQNTGKGEKKFLVFLLINSSPTSSPREKKYEKQKKKYEKGVCVPL